jgi:phosphatidylinositol-3,4,5-trisphosphate 3-phosphatase and dual-specificity protein phosphatase PTEN
MQNASQKAAVNLVKKFVSKKKNRFQEDGFDLDLSYITDQIIAMGFPANEFEGIYRNHMVDVQNFLQKRHQNKFKVYNLCSEKKYDISNFEGRVEHFPFDDHNPPPFNLILPMCKNIVKKEN